MLTYSVFQTKWRTTTKAENSARGSAFVLCWRFSPGAELQANLHKRDSFCTGRSDVECVTQREGKKPCPTQAQIPSGDGAFSHLDSQRTCAVSVLLNHHFGCLDDGRHGIALLQPKFFRTATGDDTLNHVLTHSDNDVSHDVSQNKLLNSSTELVPCRDWHSQL